MDARWIIGTRSVPGSYVGLVLRREDDLRGLRNGLVACWPEDAPAQEIAASLERLAAELRRQP